MHKYFCETEREGVLSMETRHLQQLNKNSSSSMFHMLCELNIDPKIDNINTIVEFHLMMTGVNER